MRHVVKIALFAAITFPSGSHADQAQYSCVRDRYVDITIGVDVAGRGAASNPWKTIAYADANGGLTAGDCVHVAAGVYPQASTFYPSHGGNANTSTGYVAWIGAPNHATQIKATGNNMGYLVQFLGHYIVWDGFDMYGGGDTKATNNILQLGADSKPGGTVHHLQALNNWVHDAGGGGIAALSSDYFTIKGNTIWNTAHTSGYQESGIGVWEPRKITGFTPTLPLDLAPYHIVVENNIVHDNITTYPANDHTDGNGILIDDFDCTQVAPHMPYPYGAIVQSNLAYNNGGRGVGVYLGATNVLITNNTA
jgi:hypothetical protein